MAFLEACPGVGILVSGAILLTTSTLLYQQGLADLYEILPMAFMGAICADHLGFYLGRHFGLSFHTTAFAIKQEKVIKKTEKFILKYGAVAVILGRLITPIRSFVPLLTGISTMDRLKFSVFDSIACLIWCSGLASLILGLNHLFD